MSIMRSCHVSAASDAVAGRALANVSAQLAHAHTQMQTLQLRLDSVEQSFKNAQRCGTRPWRNRTVKLWSQHHLHAAHRGHRGGAEGLADRAITGG